VIVEKFEVLVAAWQVHATGVAVLIPAHKGRTNQLKQVVGRARSLPSSRLRIPFRKGRAAARVISFSAPPYCSRPRARSANKKSGLLRILETEDLREKTEKWRQPP